MTSATPLPLIILRPEPGATRTANRAENLGFRVVSSPLFAVEPRVWSEPPASDFDALLLTSANAPRHAGSALSAYHELPCLAVGEMTAEAARDAGLTVAWTGRGDGRAALEEATARKYHRLLWLCGEQHTPLVHPQITLTPLPVYTARAIMPGPPLQDALAHPAIILVHSQRAAWALADYVASRHHLGLIAISPGVAAVAGEGWAWVHWPSIPRDQDMLELAATLCQKARL